MTGHIEKKRSSRSWRIKFDAGTDAATGKRITRRMTVRGTKKDAERKLTEMLAQRDNGQLVAPNKLLLREYLEQWLASWCVAHVAPKTAERYGEVIRNQVLPHLGALPLQGLTPAHISGWYDTLLQSGRADGKPLAPGTITTARRVLHKALELAVEDGLIFRNCVTTKRAPRVPKKEITFLSPDDVTTLLTRLRGRPLFPIVLLGLASGARRGELLALRWSDVNLDAGSIRIERSLEQTRAGLRFKQPKTAAGRRNIGIPSDVAQELRTHRRAQLELRLQLGQGKLPDDYLVFCNWQGAPRNPQAVTQGFARVVAELSLPPVTLHGLRHIHASALIAAGLDVLSISKRLGHGSAAITLGVYGHLFRSRDGEAVAAISAALAGGLADKA